MGFGVREVVEMSNAIEEARTRILKCLDRVTGPAPIDYISLNSGVENPYEFLCQLEKENLITRLPPNTWYLTCSLQFSLATKLNNNVE